jgi:predicted PurR-regulated permease PerM
MRFSLNQVSIKDDLIDLGLTDETLNKRISRYVRLKVSLGILTGVIGGMVFLMLLVDLLFGK